MVTTTTASTMKKAVLMLNTYDSRNVPMVIGFNGEKHFFISTIVVEFR